MHFGFLGAEIYYCFGVFDVFFLLFSVEYWIEFHVLFATFLVRMFVFSRSVTPVFDQTLTRAIEEELDGWMDGWMDGSMDGWMDGCKDAWMHGWMDGWINGWIDRQME